MTRSELYKMIVADHPGITCRALWEKAHRSNEYGNHGVKAGSPWPILDAMAKHGELKRLPELSHKGVPVKWYPK